MGEGQICQFRSMNNYALRFLAHSRFLVWQSVLLRAEKHALLHSAEFGRKVLLNTTIPLDVDSAWSLALLPLYFLFSELTDSFTGRLSKKFSKLLATHTLQKEQVLSSFSDRSIDPLIYRLQHGGFQWVQPLLTCCWLQPQWLSILLSPLVLHSREFGGCGGLHQPGCFCNF